MFRVLIPFGDAAIPGRYFDQQRGLKESVIQRVGPPGGYWREKVGYSN